ncbi:MAG: transketolase [Deltaproteobacteria bacterium]|nr:MAG: transketolase [Deltaproteobacteria bacterium]
MRNAFAEELTALASEDERIVLLSGDIGNRMFNDYKSRFLGRFLNCGVAEANMMSMAAGMALCGLRPITYTIASFATIRCLEQIRIDICYHNLPVTIVGVGGGLCYAANGATHHACEDIASLRILPNMTVICPGDAWEVRLALRAAIKHKGPVYIRLGKKGEPVVHEQVPDFAIGKGIIVREGSEVCLFSTGNILPLAIQASEELGKKGISAQVVSLHTVKPIDENLLSEAFSEFSIVVTVEEHSLFGGLGGSVAEWLADHPHQKAGLVRIGTDDKFLHEAGGQDYARLCFGLTPETIAEKTWRAYQASVSSDVT